MEPANPQYTNLSLPSLCFSLILLVRRFWGDEEKELLFRNVQSLMDNAQHRVHLRDVEAPMENGHYPPKYVILNNTTSTNLKPPPQRRNVPKYHGRHSSGGHCCIRCVCCCFCFWFILILLLSGIVIFLFTSLQPKMPVYNVEYFEVIEFSLHQDFSLYAEFLVSVRANNPNDHIAFVYGKGSSVVVLYSGSILCSGKLPEYRQPHNNISVMDVVLKGKSEFGSGLQEAMAENKNSERIPLLVMVDAPISVVLKQFPMREFFVYVNCSLVVDNLSPKKDARILSTTYNYSVGL